MWSPKRSVCNILISIIISFLVFVKSDSDSNVISHDLTENLERTCLFYGIFKEIRYKESECSKEINLILDGIQNRDVWALKSMTFLLNITVVYTWFIFLDANPNLPSSFVNGNNFWFLPSRVCDGINEPMVISLSECIPNHMKNDLLNSTSPVRVQHRMIYANFSTLMQVDIPHFHVKKIIHIGLCLPESCSDNEIVESTQSFFNKNQTILQQMFQINLTIIGTRTTDYNTSLFKETCFYGLCLIFIFAVMTTSISLYTKFQINENAKETEYDIEDNGHTNSKQKSEASIFQRTFQCFDVIDNYNRLFQKSSSNNYLSTIAGMRTVACIWIITYHINYHSAFTLDNFAQMYIKMEHFMYQLIFQAYLYVDVFFAFSAIILSYNFLKNDETRKSIVSNSLTENCRLFLKFCVHRYIRLTPVLILTMILSEVVLSYLEKFSPFWIDHSNDLYCRDTWWLNMLYIQNFFTLSGMCSSWTWFLACDMQFYIVCLFMLFVYAKNSQRATYIYGTLTVVTLAFSYYLNYVNNITFNIDVSYVTADILYIKPHTRFNPYLGGLLIGYVLYKVKDTKVELRSPTVVAFWTIAVVIFSFTVPMTLKRDVATWLCALWFSLGKFTFGLFIGSVVLICQFGYGGLFSKAMSNQIFIHLNKLTYSMYMVSPIVITVFYGLKETSSHFDEASSVMSLLSVTIISYLASLLIVIFFELPFQRISDEFILKKVKRNACKN